MDELSTLNAAKRGDQEAFLALLEPIEIRLYQTALGIVGNPYDAEDVWQNTVLNAWRHIKGLREPYFKTWITRILLNEAKNILRKRGRTPTPIPTIPEMAETKDISQALAMQDYLNLLSDPQREVVLLRFWLDLPLGEIASLAGIPLSTAKTRLYQGLAVLKALIKEDDVRGN